MFFKLPFAVSLSVLYIYIYIYAATITLTFARCPTFTILSGLFSLNYLVLTTIYVCISMYIYIYMKHNNSML